jgi:hypothetical protein
MESEVGNGSSNEPEPATSIQQAEMPKKKRQIIISGNLSNAEARQEYQRRYYQITKKRPKSTKGSTT